MVTFKAFIGGESKDIRRWDNVGKEDHMDIFFLNRKDKKHQRAPIKNINKLGDLKRLFAYIDRNYTKFIEEYKR